MELALTKRFLLACQEAKTIVERQPRLPQGMRPGHVRVLDTIHQLSLQQEQVRAGDVGRTMGITRPSITRLTHELVEMGCVEQKQLEEDRRVFLVELTAKGEKIYDYYVRQFHQWFNEQLAQVSPSDLEAAIRMIHQAASVMEQVPEQFEQAKKEEMQYGK